VSDPITTEELLDAGEERTGLLRGQLLLMVAKSAAIRHIAINHGEKFVLKGGSLLTHVYGSPRQSIADADYYHLDADTVTTVDLEEAFTVAGDGFELDAEFRYRDPSMFEGAAVFEIDQIDLSPAPQKKWRRGPELKVMISIRTGEWLDPHDQELYYHDPLLAGDDRFRVQGLSLDELAAEKLLGWCTKDLAKHFVDPAYLKREYDSRLDYAKIASLVARKFEAEKGERRYRELGIDSLAKLGPRFTSEERIDRVIRGDWTRLAQNDILFLPQEEARGDGETLTDVENVIRSGLAFWGSLDPELAKLHAPQRR
jgi:predicted nucleotidyltransferase component of viral defense system